jgi:hypothetical protein
MGGRGGYKQKGKGSGGGQRGGQRGPQGNSAPGRNVCKPQVQKLSPSLIPIPKHEPVPSVLQTALPEFSASQCFFSALERMQPDVASLHRMNACWLGISGESIQDLRRDPENPFFAELLTVSNETIPVFIKRIHSMDPIAVIQGECILPEEGSLPAPADLWMTTLEKVNDPMNEAYVDAVFAAVADRMVATKLSPHWCRSYGTFPARVSEYSYNISDEYPSLRKKPFWQRNQEMGLFEHRIIEEDLGECSRGNREPKAIFSEELSMDDLDIEEIELVPTQSNQSSNPSSNPTSSYSELEECDQICELQHSPEYPVRKGELDTVNVKQSQGWQSNQTSRMSDCDMEVGDSVQLVPPRVRIKKLQKTEESESSDSSDGSEEDFNEHFAEFKNFPVQVTLLERAEGTLDELLDAEENLTPDRELCWKAWIFQIVAGLSVAQHHFGFVHNDLHTNNVMWSTTDIPYLYYKVHKGPKDQTWILRVPTFGYIMKIIDFGRASYWLPEPAGFFISDAFFPGNDACNQYNCEPFFDPKAGKKVEPNPSFDLCRLSVSMIESLYPKRPENATPIKIVSREGNKTYAETASPLYNLLWQWLLDDEGKNVLREPSGEERYPDFDLYSAIAADVHTAVPGAQIEKPLFAEYKWTNPVPHGQDVYDLWVR